MKGDNGDSSGQFNFKEVLEYIGENNHNVRQLILN